jgi:N-carbamoylputrescine amidase
MEEEMEFAGESFVCGPDGRVLARAGSGTEEILTADVDLAAAGRSHARRLFLKHRRPELYAEWYCHPSSRTGSTGTYMRRG